jgi:hypothetical protein
VTVCVAALGSGRVVGVSDRMITAGDIQYEPQQAKVWPLTSSIAAMYSGDTAIQTEVLKDTALRIGPKISANPTEWLSVREVAQTYGECFQTARLIRAERAILRPLGLTTQLFLDQMQTMDSDVVRQLVNKLDSYQFFEPNSALIVGVDEDGYQEPGKKRAYAHIYVAHEAEVTCQDRVGFAAIGIGTSHAESQFMFAGYDSKWTFPKTLLLAHAAKKRAEASPGVGRATDMFAIGPALGSYFVICDHVVKELDENFNQALKRIQKANKKSEERMTKFDQELSRRVADSKQAISGSQPGNPITSETPQT